MLMNTINWYPGMSWKLNFQNVQEKSCCSWAQFLVNKNIHFKI